VNTDEARKALGVRVRRRREDLGLTIDQAAELASLSPVTWSRVEFGRAVRGLTYAAVDHVLEWTSGSSRTILEGGEARILSSIEVEISKEDASDPDYGDDFEERVDAIRHDPMARKRFLELLRAGLLGAQDEEDRKR
jgi:transcriptional regulator with XRE-family HTH domain